LVSEPARPSESVRDLKNDAFSVKLEAEPIEALKFTVRPLKNEAARPSESDRDLNSETCSVKLEVEPSEPLKVLARPLV